MPLLIIFFSPLGSHSDSNEDELDDPKAFLCSFSVYVCRLRLAFLPLMPEVMQ